MATIKPLTAPAKRLSESITGASTTFKVNSITGWAGTDLTSADFGSKAYAAFRNSAGTLLELMEIDPATVTAVSSAITILKRGLKFDGDLTTEVAGNKLVWIKGDTIVEFGTHFPQLLKSFVDIYGAQTIEGIKTFSSSPVVPTPVSATETANKAYVDLVVAGIATTVNLIVPGVAGETIAAGQLIYLKAADGRWWLCDADTATTVENVNLGIAQGAGAAAGAIAGGILTQGLDSNQSALTASTKYYAGNTAGAISTSAGTKEVTVGFSHPTDATKLYFIPRFDQQLTENQQDIITAIEAGTDFYAASAVGTDSYAITISPAITAYTTGMKFRFKADVGNTGACTLAVSGLSALAIKKLNDQDTATGDIEAGQIVEVVYDGVDFQMQSQTAVATATVDVQVFTSSGTWTKPTGALAVEVYAVGAGGGGGSGRRAAAAATISGGSGGGGGSLSFKKFNASGLAATETVTIGAGGAGGAGVSGGDANGNNGVAGGDTTFGTTALLVAKGGSAGLAGIAGSPAGGAGGVIANGDITTVGGVGGAGRNDDAAGDAGVDTANVTSPRGGGAGGGFNASSAAKNGGVGGGFITNYVKAGGAIGTIGNSSIALFYGGTGGGGSTAASTSAVGGAGINGSGGGGSGAGSTASGNGGAGGDGFCIVISYL